MNTLLSLLPILWLLKSAFPWFVGVLAAACLLTGLIAGCL